MENEKKRSHMEFHVNLHYLKRGFILSRENRACVREGVSFLYPSFFFIADILFF
jgi:hypothetical protein